MATDKPVAFEPTVVEIPPRVTRRFLVSGTPGYIDAVEAVAKRHPAGEPHPWYKTIKAGKPTALGQNPDGAWLVVLTYEADLPTAEP